MEKQITPMQELIEWVNETDSFINLKAKEMVINKATELLEKERKVIIDFGNKLLDDQTGQNGCGCGKDGGGDYPEKLFNKTFEVK